MPIKWVVPQATMNSANSQKIQLNWISLRPVTKRMMAIGIEKQAAAISRSATTWVQTSFGSQSRQ